MNLLPPLATFLTCYILGSFPTAYIVGRANHINIFEVGSGNMGANNVTRALGLKWGVLVWLVDGGKGVLAVVLARMIMPWDAWAASVLGSVAVVIGHNWSVLAALITGTLRGGKGAATAGGTWIIMMAPWWYIVVITITLWGALVLLTRYVSLAVLISVAIGSAWVLLLVSRSDIPAVYSIYVILVALMIYVRHWKNIQSLLAGKERRFGDRTK